MIVTHNGYTNSKGKFIPPVDIDNYPSIKEHLDSYGQQISVRQDKGVTPYNLRSCVYMEDFFRPKIIYIDIMTDNEAEGYSFPAFAYANNEIFMLNTAYFMVGDPFNLKYVLGILNSKLGKFIVKSTVTPLQKRQYRLFRQFVELFPIPTPTKEQQSKVVAIIDEILISKNQSNEVRKMEEQINQIVHDICNLDDSEQIFLFNQE